MGFVLKGLVQNDTRSMRKETTNLPARAPARRFTLSLKPAVGLRGYKDRRMARIAIDFTPRLSSLARGTTEADLNRLRDRLLQPLIEEANDVALLDSLRRAANEAAAAAWLTPFPLLFLPALFEEKARKATAQVARQKAILRKTQRSVQNAAA